MDKLSKDVIHKLRIFRSKKFSKFGKYLVSKNITPNYLTLLSLISALLAVYFLFDNWYLLVVFTFLHLILDAMDGVVARISGSTKLGEFFDNFADNFPVFLIFIKFGWLVGDNYVYIIAGLFLIEMVIFFGTKLESPFIPMRTVAFILLILLTSPIFVNIKLSWIFFVSLIGGIFSVYGLARQLQWYINKN